MAVILSINGNIDNELRELGHVVISQRIDRAGLYSALKLHAQCEPKPDFFIQRESLSAIIILYDAHKLPCRTAFWSIDTHLNFSWQMYYAKIFDVFLTPHKYFIERLPKDWLHSNTHRMPHNGFEHPFIPHEKRKYNINFVGRLTGTRPQRNELAKLLETKYNTKIIDNISFSQVITMYADTRIIPNESIANEVNFRILEGASCGACVISPPVGKDQDLLLEPGKEFLIYNSMHELQEILDKCLHNPKYCEEIGHAAWQRVQREHTKIQRAKQLFDAVNGHENYRNKIHAHDFVFFCIELMKIYGIIASNQHMRFANTHYKIETFQIITQIFTLYHKNLKDDEIKILSEQLFNRADQCIHDPQVQTEHKKMLCIACAGLALELKDITRNFFYTRLHEKCCNVPLPSKQITDPAKAALSWVFILKREQKQGIAGIEHRKGCFLTAHDFVELCRKIDPTSNDWVIALSSLNHVLQILPMSFSEQLKNLLTE